MITGHLDVCNIETIRYRKFHRNRLARFHFHPTVTRSIEDCSRGRSEDANRE